MDISANNKQCIAIIIVVIDKAYATGQGLVA